MPGETRFARARPKNPAEKDTTAPVKAPSGRTLVVRFEDETGQALGGALNVPAEISREQLQKLVNQLLKNDDARPYSLFVRGHEVATTLAQDVLEGLGASAEETVAITYVPQAVFRVRAVSRCASTLEGHTEAVLVVAFSPDGTLLASGSGDTTVRLWDLLTATPQSTLTGHTGWVQAVAFSPDGQLLASGGMDSRVRLWDPATGRAVGAPLAGHAGSITSLAWAPFMDDPACGRLATASRDGTVRVWRARTRAVEFVLAQHRAAVTCVRWGGEGLLYTASRDKTVKVWCAATGKLVRSLDGHAHWVNHLALSSDAVLRAGPFAHSDGRNGHALAKSLAAAGGLERFASREEAAEWARAEFRHQHPKHERLVSGSDDFTLFLWAPHESKKPVARMTGHQQLVNHVSFSPDGRLVASASFDKAVKLWDGVSGAFVGNLRGHVGPVYSACWSPDSRLLVTASRDSTLKLWDLRSHKLRCDLPGHSDEVFALDWSLDGARVSSGGKDRVLKVWCA